MNVDLILCNAVVFNVYLKTWLNCDVVIHKGRFLYIGNIEDKDFIADEIFDCKEKPLIPGMIDIHLHIESSMCSPKVFSEAVLKRGVTTIVSEPHEIANIFGIDGIKEMIKVSKNLPLDIFYGVPSSVPSTTEKLETTGGIIEFEELKELIDTEKSIVCLGEVMNFRDLIDLNEKSKIADFISFLRKEAPLLALEGHCPEFTDLDLAKILYMGVDSDHCLMSLKALKQRIENGMFVELQEKSISQENIDYLSRIDSDGLFSFVTDDSSPNVFIDKGHLDFLVRKALKYGMPLEKAIIASSYSPAKRIGFRDRGAIAPGKLADAILLNDTSKDFRILEVFKKGKRVSRLEEGKTAFFNKKFYYSINICSLKNNMFDVHAPTDKKLVTCRTIEKNPDNTFTKLKEKVLPVKTGFIDWEHKDINFLIVIERYTGNADFSRGFMTGCIFKNGAAATTYAHDSHNIFAAGDNKKDMKTAIDWIIKNNGGICVVSEGRVIASVVLPIAGIMSNEPMEVLSKKVKEIQQAMSSLGFKHKINPLMSFCTVTLPVSPEIKITDKGIIDTQNGKILNIIVEN